MIPTLNSKLKQVHDALLEAADEVHHYRRPQGKNRFVVWQEDSEDSSFHGDNRKGEQQIHGTVDLYTKKEYDPWVDSVQAALHESGIGWRLNSVQYEDETNLIHYEWEFEVA